MICKGGEDASEQNAKVCGEWGMPIRSLNKGDTEVGRVGSLGDRNVRDTVNIARKWLKTRQPLSFLVHGENKQLST